MEALELLLIFILVSIPITAYILIVISEWRIFKKAGEKGWKSLIPLYGIFVSHHIAGMSHIWFIIEMMLWVFETFIVSFIHLPHWFEEPFALCTLLFTIAAEITHMRMLGKRFGKSRGFITGMVLLPPVFTAILAFGSAQYTGSGHREKEAQGSPR